MVNGLLLMNLQRKIVELNLCNPCIRKSVLLPDCPLISKSDDVEHLGFGNDCKVVCFELGELSIAIAIYSLRDHRWRVKPNWTNVPR
uniref:F-box protein n=1 Tax=Chenopodium quinoa TaxID=63459 RepID=A0A803M3E5_CHEQI